MKYVIFTYDIRMKGKEDEACMTVLLDDDRAAVVKAAYDTGRGAARLRTSSCGARSMTCAPPVKRSGGGSTFATASSAWRSRRLEP